MQYRQTTTRRCTLPAMEERQETAELTCHEPVHHPQSGWFRRQTARLLTRGCTAWWPTPSRESCRMRTSLPILIIQKRHGGDGQLEQRDEPAVTNKAWVEITTVPPNLSSLGIPNGRLECILINGSNGWWYYDTECSPVEAEQLVGGCINQRKSRDGRQRSCNTQLVTQELRS
jgi:hypothetical protein